MKNLIVCILVGILFLGIVPSVLCQNIYKVYINEIRANDDGIDDIEFIELIGPAETDITGFEIRHYNGLDTSDGEVWIHTIGTFTIQPVDGVTDSEGNAVGFYVLGDSSVSNVDEDLPGTDDDSNIQNGPDGIILYDASDNILDAVAWQGAGDLPDDDPGTVATSGDTTANNYLHVTIDDVSDDDSLQAPNDVLGDDGSGWTLAAATPGAINSGQTSGDISLPVRLSSFAAISTDSGVLLKWTTEAEIGHVGWNIYRSEEKDREFVKVNDELIEGVGYSAMPRNYKYIDNTAKAGKHYYYYLEDIDISGRTDKSDIISTKGYSKKHIAIIWGSIKK